MAELRDFEPEDKYDEFPPSETVGVGPETGFNEFVRLNDPRHFTDEARRNPVIRAFLEAPFSVTYLQLKSSTREAEWFIHKPHRAMGGELEDRGLHGSVEDFPREGQRISTLVLNHEETLALRPMRMMIVEDGAQAGVMIYKGNGTKELPFFGDGEPPDRA
jgi:hypothetical protein